MGSKIAIVWAFSLMAIMCLMTACADSRAVRPVSTVEVGIPIMESCEAPAELERQPMPLPIFITPTAPAAVIALDKENAALLRSLLRDREIRLNAWERWGLRI